MRYYDQIGLLKPSYINDSGYRIYTSEEVDKLQQIVFFREQDVSIADIVIYQLLHWYKYGTQNH